MSRLAIVLTVVGCAGQAPTNAPPPDVDADPGTPPATGQKVSGKAIDYFTSLPMADSAIATDGIDPPLMATSIADGSWSLDNVPIGSKIFLSAGHTSYRTTRNIATAVGETEVVQDVYEMAVADVTRQYTTNGRTPTGGRAVLVAELQVPAGTPLEGIPLANVTLVDGADAPVPGIVGPFFFGSAGDVDPALTTATAFGGRSRVAFLDVPAGAFALKVIDAAAATVATSVVMAPDGATLALSKGPLSGGGNVTDPKFATDIFPRFQRAALGGTGCANCHTANGPGAILILDDNPTDVLARLNPPAPAGRIDTATPASSRILTMPLYEQAPPQNHPNATFLDINDPDYKLILLWITNGLKP